MSFVDERKAIESELNDNWTTTPIQWENVPFDIPSSSGVLQPYIAMSLLPGEGEQIELGTVPLYRWVGVIVIQIFVPEHHTSGPGLASQYAETLKAIFLRKQLSQGSSGRILTRVPYMSVQGVVEGWYQVNLNTNYVRDQTS